MGAKGIGTMRHGWKHFAMLLHWRRVACVIDRQSKYFMVLGQSWNDIFSHSPKPCLYPCVSTVQNLGHAKSRSSLDATSLFYTGTLGACCLKYSTRHLHRAPHSQRCPGMGRLRSQPSPIDKTRCVRFWSQARSRLEGLLPLTYIDHKACHKTAPSIFYLCGTCHVTRL